MITGSTYIGVDFDGEALSNSNGIKIRVINIGRYDSSALGYAGSENIRIDIFLLGHHSHSLCDNSISSLFQLCHFIALIY